MEVLKAYFNRMGEMPASEFDKINPFLRSKKLSKGAVFVQSPQICNSIMFIVKGSMRAYFTKDDGLEVNILLRKENEFITDFESFLTQQPAKYCLEALEDCDLIVFSRVGYELLSSSPYWNNVFRIIAEGNYISARRRAEDLLFLSPKQRYLKVLKEDKDLLQRFSLKHIAAYIGVRQQSLSRMRSHNR